MIEAITPILMAMSAIADIANEALAALRAAREPLDRDGEG